ncbi:MAG: response regulator [Lapillicoccus sp.]
MAVVTVIEDDPAIRSGLVRALGERGHVVTTSATGISGLQQVIDTRPDLVVLDLGLPDVDGLQVLSMLRAVSSVPVIVVTARDEDDVVVGALDAGADDYVV